ncbi:NACHT, LRR and PYD domains-containing protein 3-like isoform X2 [Alosa pseudoharengus]|uniref:NACHT, LRR and PYD domains-containing protein 3-like isoform X2 n=1 Tax=Alosa pseudoharengus TaxID=34774 RepID=UPI003F8877F8
MINLVPSDQLLIMANQLDFLFHAMDHLKPDQLKRFKLYLSHRTLDDVEPIPKERLGNSDATDVVETMVEEYSTECAVRLTAHILRKINRTDLAEALEKGKEEGPGQEGQAVDTVPSATLTQDQSKCEVCEQLTRDLVITSCGHSFCRQCISSSWSQSSPSGDYSCAKCGKRCRTHFLQTMPEAQPIDNKATCTPPAPAPAPSIHTTVSAESGAIVSAHSLNSCHIEGSVYFNGEPGDKGDDDNAVLESVQMNHKALMKQKSECIFEGVEKKDNKILLNKIYTDLYITEGESEGVNDEHEVWQLETVSRKPVTEDTPINCNDIFKPLPGQDGPIRSVLTKGIAGIGKTVSVQKFILDWAEGRANDDIHFVFAFSFRELNLVRGKKYNLLGLLLDFHPELRELYDTRKCFKRKTVIVFDGLDESRLKLDFRKTRLADVTEVTSVDVLVANLINGKLLPTAHIWVTSRPAAAGQIPTQYVDQLTEVRGFNLPQREEYFRKKISDPTKAERIIAHIKVSRSLHIMCHIPVFCWISAIVLQKILDQGRKREIPKTLTEMYAHFLLIQANIKSQKYHGGSVSQKQKLLESNRGLLLKLAKLAFLNLERGNLMFYEADLHECGINIDEASIYCGMCTEILKEEEVFYEKKVYCFVHLSIQEFLAAVHVFYSYISHDMGALAFFLKGKSRASHKNISLDVLLNSVVTKASESDNGHLDLFVRFLHGLSLESNQRLLLGLLTRTERNLESVNRAVKNLKEMQRKNVSPERCINLFHCLIEMNDASVHDEIQMFLNSEKGPGMLLSPAHCSALAYMLLMSEEALDEFDLTNYKTSDEGRRRLLPVVRLGACKLTERPCETIQSALQCFSSHLRELVLSHSDIQDSGMRLIATGLMSPHCKLETLRLYRCKLTEKGWANLVSAFQSETSHLRELDLTDNDLQDSGIRLLCPALSCPGCTIQTLRMKGCQETGETCEVLASALRAGLPSLRELDLSLNEFEYTAANVLLTSMTSPQCQLETLRLKRCGLTYRHCEALASVLESGAACLRELDLSDNDLDDHAVERLSSGLMSANCALRTLRLKQCCLTVDACAGLTSALCSTHCPLTELDLSCNTLQDSGVVVLCQGLESPNCKLETLRLSFCCVSERGCIAVAAALTSRPACLRALDLSYNHPGDAGMRALRAREQDPNCHLMTVNFDHGGIYCLTTELRKYACMLSFNPDTMQSELSLSEDSRSVACVAEVHPYPDRPERFTLCPQLLCTEPLFGRRFYWEAEWSGSKVLVGVSYERLERKAAADVSGLGANASSWALEWTGISGSYRAWHDERRVDVPSPPRSWSTARRVGVLLDCLSGTLSFYGVSPSSGQLTHLHTFYEAFSEPLYAGFWVAPDCCISLCQLASSTPSENHEWNP